MSNFQAHGASAAQATAGLLGQIIHQAYFLATIDLFRISAWLLIVLIPLIWLTRPARGTGGAAAAD